MKKNTIYVIILKFFLMQLGAVLAAVALRYFLVPNNIIDGGIVGISIIFHYIFKFPLGFFIVVLNIPFIIFGYKKLGKEFVISTLYSIISLSVWVSFFKSSTAFTHDLFLSSIFGGIILGLGVGLIIRNGGSLDGTEIISIMYNKIINFSIGEIVFFFNIFIFSSAGFVFGWEKVMYSLVTYFIAFKVIDIIVEGIDDAKAIFIISQQYQVINESLIKEFKRGITVFNGRGGFSNEEKDILYIIVRRSEIYKLKQIVHKFDDSAFISIQDIHEVVGKNIHKW